MPGRFGHVEMRWPRVDPGSTDSDAPSCASPKEDRAPPIKEGRPAATRMPKSRFSNQFIGGATTPFVDAEAALTTNPLSVVIGAIPVLKSSKT